MAASSASRRRTEQELERSLRRGGGDASAGFDIPDDAHVVELNGDDMRNTNWEASMASAPPQPKREKVEVVSKVWDSRKGQAVVTSEPSHMQKRKHQINSLAYQAKQMAADLATRSGAGHKTKAQTYSKYGW